DRHVINNCGRVLSRPVELVDHTIWIVLNASGFREYTNDFRGNATCASAFALKGYFDSVVGATIDLPEIISLPCKLQGAADGYAAEEGSDNEICAPSLSRPRWSRIT